MAERRPAPGTPRLAVVGIGDDGPAGLGQHARDLIRRAELLAGGRRHLAFFPDHPAEKLVLADDLDAVLDRLQSEAALRWCAVLASGDPCFFGIGPRLVERLGRERVEIIPHLSSVALAFARLGLAWHDATILSAHGRPLETVLGPAVAADKIAILTDDQNTPAAIASALLAAGLPDCRAWVCEHLGGPAERLVETSLVALPAQTFARLNVLVLLPSPPASQLPSRPIARPESAYRQARGQITKAEVRAVVLAKLRLPPGGVLWDVGAGAGSVAIEAAALMGRGAVYAVERDAEQLACLRENVRRHLTPQVRIVAGSAPAALHDLPRPDRIFVGGGGAALPAILEACLDRLPSHGRLVVSAATIESTLEAQTCLRQAGWSGALVQLSVSRGREIGGRTRLDPLGPVFILTAWPGDGGMGGWGDGEP